MPSQIVRKQKKRKKKLKTGRGLIPSHSEAGESSNAPRYLHLMKVNPHLPGAVGAASMFHGSEESGKGTWNPAKVQTRKSRSLFQYSHPQRLGRVSAAGCRPGPPSFAPAFHGFTVRSAVLSPPRRAA